jgi:hypothetical protein
MVFESGSKCGWRNGAFFNSARRRHLQFAIQNEATNRVRLLLESAKTTPETAQDLFRTALSHGIPEIIDLFLASPKVDVNQFPFYLLECAARSKLSSYGVNILLGRAHVIQVDILSHAILNDAHPDVISRLLQDPRIDPNLIDEWLMLPAIHYAAYTAKNWHLLSSDPRVDVNMLAGDDNITPLLGMFSRFRLAHYNFGIDVLLADPRVDVDARDAHGNSVLHLAMYFFHRKNIIASLLNCPRVNVNAQDENGDTPLHKAIMYIKTDNVAPTNRQWLGQNRYNFREWNAASHDVIEMLIKHPRVDRTIVNNDGFTPYMGAKSLRLKRICAMLEN